MARLRFVTLYKFDMREGRYVDPIASALAYTDMPLAQDDKYWYPDRRKRQGGVFDMTTSDVCAFTCHQYGVAWRLMLTRVSVWLERGWPKGEANVLIDQGFRPRPGRLWRLVVPSRACLFGVRQVVVNQSALPLYDWRRYAERITQPKEV